MWTWPHIEPHNTSTANDAHIKELEVGIIINSGCQKNTLELRGVRVNALDGYLASGDTFSAMHHHSKTT